jgi:hypothetical protein
MIQVTLGPINETNLGRLTPKSSFCIKSTNKKEATAAAPLK